MMWSVPGGRPATLTPATNDPSRSVICTRPVTRLPPIATSGKFRLRTVGGAAGAAAAGGRAAAGGVEGGIGATLVGIADGEGVSGIEAGASDVPVVDAHALSSIADNAGIKKRRTRIATRWGYARNGMSGGDA
jgi:hypothetical protein